MTQVQTQKLREFLEILHMALQSFLDNFRDAYNEFSSPARVALEKSDALICPRETKDLPEVPKQTEG